jgi:hypothetical protein
MKYVGSVAESYAGKGGFPTRRSSLVEPGGAPKQGACPDAAEKEPFSIKRFTLPGPHKTD